MFRRAVALAFLVCIVGCGPVPESAIPPATFTGDPTAREAPMLAQLVAAGELPPLDQR
ncbi:hypothetical protein HOK31_29280, partial [Candidatus Poribacteria bacterium]|nr:hypothetical protein [Candidatus Poribacteria bacterium]